MYLPAAVLLVPASDIFVFPISRVSVIWQKRERPSSDRFEEISPGIDFGEGEKKRKGTIKTSSG
jgi:hypothetical protein